MKNLSDEERTYTVTFTGDREEQANGHYLIMSSGGYSSIKKNEFMGISKKTIRLIKKCSIPFKILKW